MTAHSIAETLQTIGLQAKTASALMAKAPTAVKNTALRKLAALLRANVQSLQVDNARDLERAIAAGLAEPIVSRIASTACSRYAVVGMRELESNRRFFMARI